MYDVFISYKHKEGQHQKDADFARKLYQKLTELDIKCFIDHECIGSGKPWGQEIENSLVASSFFVMIMTQKYFASKMCFMEYEMAIPRHYNDDLCIIPVLLEACDIPERIKSIQYQDFRDEQHFDDTFKKLYTLLSQKLHKTAKKEALWKKYTCMINRHPQYNFFFDQVDEQFSNNKKHAICIFHGHKDECLGEFCDCITNYQWHSRNNDDVPLKRKFINWPEEPDNNEVLRELKLQIVSPASTLESLYSALQQNNMMIYSEIDIDVHAKDPAPYLERISHFVNFWNKLPVHETENILITCLLIRYTHKKQKNFLFKLRKKKSIKDDIVNQLKNKHAKYLANEMNKIEGKHIRTWKNHLIANIKKGERKDFDEIEKYFETNPAMPMKELRDSTLMESLLIKLNH